MGRLDGWRREAREEDIDGAADQQFNNKKRSVYSEAFEAAKRLQAQDVSPEEIRRKLFVQPQILKNPYDDGRPIPKHFEADNRAEVRLADLAKEAVEDALGGKEPRKDY